MNNDLEYIDRYFQGSPLPEEKDRFEKRLVDDPEFAGEVAFYLNVIKVAQMQATEDKKEHFRQLYRQNPPKTATIRPVKWLYAAAAVIVFMVAGIYLFLRPPVEQRLAEGYIKENLQTLEVSMNDVDNALQEGLSLYNEGQFAAAARQFEKVIQADTSNYPARKYAGIAYLRLNDYDKALYFFTQLESYTELHANPAKLYRALTLLKRNRPGDAEEARKLLQQVVDRNLEGRQHAEHWLRKL